MLTFSMNERHGRKVSTWPQAERVVGSTIDICFKWIEILAERQKESNGLEEL